MRILDALNIRLLRLNRPVLHLRHIKPTWVLLLKFEPLVALQDLLDVGLVKNPSGLSLRGLYFRSERELRVTGGLRHQRVLSEILAALDVCQRCSLDFEICGLILD